MKILILGGTGAMGQHLVQLLTKNKTRITVTSRSKKKSYGNISYIEGDAHNKEFLNLLLLTKWNVIIDFMVYTIDEFTHRAILLLNSCSQYVYLSSARVYANSSQLITENSPLLLNVSKDKEYLSGEEYAITKAKQENILKNSGLKNWTIIRPYITYSENRLQLGILEKDEWLYRAIHKRTIVFSKDIATKITTLTYGKDVAKGILAIVGKPDTYGNTYHITTNDKITWDKVLNIYLEVIEEHLGYKPKVLLIDSFKFNKLYPSKKYQIKYDRLYNRKFSNIKISKHLDVSNFTSPERGLKECLQSFMPNPNYKSINWKSEAIKDKLTNEITSLSEITNYKQKLKYLYYRFISN